MTFPRRSLVLEVSVAPSTPSLTVGLRKRRVHIRSIDGAVPQEVVRPVKRISPLSPRASSGAVTQGPTKAQQECEFPSPRGARRAQVAPPQGGNHRAERHVPNLVPAVAAEAAGVVAPESRRGAPAAAPEPKDRGPDSRRATAADGAEGGHSGRQPSARKNIQGVMAKLEFEVGPDPS